MRALGSIKTVLVIDNDPEWHRTIVQAIGRQYPVVWAPDGNVASRIINQKRPDIILVNLASSNQEGDITEQRVPNPSEDIPMIIFSKRERLSSKVRTLENNKSRAGRSTTITDNTLDQKRLYMEIEKILEGVPVAS